MKDGVILHFACFPQETDCPDIKCLTVVHDPECTTDDEDEDDDIRLVHKSFIKGGEYLPCLRYAFLGFIYNGPLSIWADIFRVLPTGDNPCQCGAK